MLVLQHTTRPTCLSLGDAGMDPSFNTNQLKMSDQLSLLSPLRSISTASDLVPIAFVLLFVLQIVLKHSIKRGRKIFTSKNSEGGGKRRLFSVFISKDDVLESYDIRVPPATIEEDEEVAANVVYSAPGLELALIPLVETFVWVNATVEAINGHQEWREILPAASMSTTWIFALFFQISRSSPLASLRLFTLYLVLFLRAVTQLVVSIRSLYYSNSFPQSDFFTEVLDIAAIGWLLTTVMTLPLRAPLDLVIRLEHGATENSRPPSPEDTNTIIGEITYSWMNQLMKISTRRPLGSLDVFALALNNRSAVLSRRFQSLTDKTLTRRLLRASARDVAIDASLKLTAVAAEYCRPFFVQKILEQLVIDYNSPSRSFEDDRATVPLSPREKAYIYALLAFASMVTKTLAQQRHFHFARRIGMRLRSELTVDIFDKALRRRNVGGPSKEENSEDQQESASVGKVITLVSEDTNRVLRMGCDSHLLYGSPLEVVVGLSLLYNLMGLSAFVGFAILLVLSPLNYYVGRLAVPVAASRLESRDLRQSALQELFSSIRAIKLAGWSEAFVERILDKRKVELRWIRKAWILRLLLIFIWVAIGASVSIFSFCFYIYLQHETLTIPVAFTALSYFSLIQNPLYQIPDFVVKILQLRVSINRLETFLEEKEVEEHARREKRHLTDKLAFEQATLKYPGSNDTFSLQGIDIQFPRGGLTIISGSVGAGKSSLLLGLLGELDVVSGQVALPPSVSFAAQHPWLESLTIRENILFGHPFDPERFKSTVRACSLERDLELLPDGDLTFCGERGISLSGGQAARVALARAIYSPSEVVLLDDVFSAVDATTSAHLVQHLFGGSLLAGRTCVLVTHHVDLILPVASYHVHMEDGRISEQSKLVPMQTSTARDGESVETLSEETKRESIKGQTAHVEGWTSGSVKGSMYTTYLSDSSWIIWIGVVVLLLLLPILEFGERLWLARWGEAGGKSTNFYVLGYSAIASIVVFMIILPQALAMMSSLRASRNLFRRLLLRVVHAPLRWIDSIPMGTLSNRFTNDIATVDDSLAVDFSTFAHQGTSMAIALLAGGFILPSAVVPTLIFAAIYAYIFRNYLYLNRDANRIASTTASPLFASFAEALRGTTTIRAFSKESQFRNRLCHIVDETLAFWYLSATLDIWLDIRTQFLAALCLFSTAVFAIYSDSVSPGLAGVAIASSQTVINSLSYLCTSWGRLVLDLNALERITEYLEVPQEPIGGVVPPAIWPSSTCEGSLIRVENLIMRYDPHLPPVINDISFDVRAGERIGIVGRTGAGKSTLATSLLRFSDPHVHESKILIDGLDIAKVSLEDLRKRITYLPQEATLFEGTIRENVDLFSEHTDEECLGVLRQVHLFEAEDKKSIFALSTRVSAGGSNLSAGQRQLIAMARALLKDSRIVIFDESTASLDHELDEKIQQVVREEFKDAAILTIAHRLRTVRDYDRIIVLEAGKIVELDTPDKLLSNENGFFKRMWAESQGNPNVEE
ncbi:hypothetical protein JCM3765_006634 [Sporobolomyces pararoseus]